MNELFVFLSNWLLEHKSLEPLPSLTAAPPETSLTLVFYPKQTFLYNASPNQFKHTMWTEQLMPREPLDGKPTQISSFHNLEKPPI